MLHAASASALASSGSSQLPPLIARLPYNAAKAFYLPQRICISAYDDILANNGLQPLSDCLDADDVGEWEMQEAYQILLWDLYDNLSLAAKLQRSLPEEFNPIPTHVPNFLNELLPIGEVTIAPEHLSVGVLHGMREYAELNCVRQLRAIFGITPGSKGVDDIVRGGLEVEAKLAPSLVSTSSKTEGANRPDLVVRVFHGLRCNPKRTVYLIYELKWIQSAVRLTVPHAYAAQAAALRTMKAREVIYQTLFGMAAAGEICNTNLGVSCLLDSFLRVVRVSDSEVLLEVSRETALQAQHFSGQTEAIGTGYVSPRLTMAQLDSFDEVFEQMPNRLFNHNDEGIRTDNPHARERLHHISLLSLYCAAMGVNTQRQRADYLVQLRKFESYSIPGDTHSSALSYKLKKRAEDRSSGTQSRLSTRLERFQEADVLHEGVESREEGQGDLRRSTGSSDISMEYGRSAGPTSTTDPQHDDYLTPWNISEPVEENKANPEMSIPPALEDAFETPASDDEDHSLIPQGWWSVAGALTRISWFDLRLATSDVVDAVLTGPVSAHH